MFKCSDCGQEFNIKPDFCDCGNNIFEEIKEPKSQQIEEKYDEIPKTHFHKENTNSKTNLNIDVAPLLIFFLCIVLSVLSVIYIGKDSLAKIEQEKNQPKEKKIKLSETKNLPSIDKIWKDIVVKAEVEPVKQVAPVLPKQETKTIVQPVAKQQPVTKTTTKTQPIKEKQNTSKQVASKKVTPKVVQQVKTQTQTPVVKTVQQQPAETKTTETKNTNTKTTAAVNSNLSKQGLAEYKVALRNTIAHSINFTKIIGDGECAVSFKIDNAGNLTGRHFSKLSDNDSLNEVVYQAILVHPTYKSPPSSYKNETLTLSVSMYGGRYQVTLR